MFLTATEDGVPSALLHNLKHNHVLHEHVVLCTVKILGVPYVPDEERYVIKDLSRGFMRVKLRFGFMQEPNVPAALKLVKGAGTTFAPMTTSYFLSRETLIPAKDPGMAVWREHLFALLMRSADTAMSFFRLPPNRVVELGSQVEI